LVLITPRVVRTTDASLTVTDDLVRRMKSIEETFVRPIAEIAPMDVAADTAS
jgi:hypothetical protein